MKRLLLSVAALLALVVAGCGNNAGATPTVTQPPMVTAAPDATPYGGGSPLPASSSRLPGY
jgi:hypothetical protein